MLWWQLLHVLPPIKHGFTLTHNNMPNRKRNNPGIFTHEAQGYTRPLRSRGEAIYGTDMDDGDNFHGDAYHSPRRPVAQPFVSDNEWSSRPSSYYDERQRSDASNYGKGGYYGTTYRHNPPDARYSGGWRSSDDRYEEGRRREFERGPNQQSDRNNRYRGYDFRNENWDEERERNNRNYYDPGQYNTGEQWNNATQGQHKGKGPRGYQRSDDRIREDAHDRLADDSFVDASDIEVVVLNGEVTLTGTVDRRADKRRAEDICESITGVKNVENRLRVKQTSGDSARDWSSSSSDESREVTKKRNADSVRNFN